MSEKENEVASPEPGEPAPNFCRCGHTDARHDFTGQACMHPGCGCFVYESALRSAAPQRSPEPKSLRPEPRREAMSAEEYWPIWSQGISNPKFHSVSKATMYEFADALVEYREGRKGQ